MKRTLSSRFIAAAVFAGAILGAASAAQAHPDIRLSIGIPVPGLPFFAPPLPLPVPVYVRQEPAYEQPRPVYVQPPTVVYERPGPPAYGDGFEREREREWAWRHHEWQRREWEQRQHDWDRYPHGDRRGRD